jgi:hypothetical protein
VGVRHEEEPAGDEEQPGAEQVARLDAHGELAGEGGHDEGQHGEREEAHPGGQRAVAQVVLDVEGQVQEHGEDRRGRA